MNALHFALLISSTLTSIAVAQPSMTIYGTFKEANDETNNEQIAKKPFAGTNYQSSINIYGTIDGGIRHVTNTTKNGGDTLKVGSNGEYYNNRIGIKGTEDLGGGMNAHFHLETGFNTGTGALDNNANRLFNRISSVGVAGAFGSIDFGRMPSVSCKTIFAYDPFQYRYVQIVPLAGAAAGNADGNFPGFPFGTMGGTRFSNDVQYIGKFDSLTILAEYSMGEVSGSNSSGSSKAVGMTYRPGPFVFGGAYTRQKPNVATGGAVDYRNQDQITLGGAYQADGLRIAGGYISTEADSAVSGVNNQAKNSWLGASYDFTPVISVTTGYYRTTLATANVEAARRNLVIVGATYALSTHTNLYAGFDKATLSGIASLSVGSKTRQTGVSLGINHMF
ncbi:Outer membrane porin protein 32 precursor [compost metagenome]